MSLSDDARANREAWPAQAKDYVTVDWARKWPAEEIWVARLAQ